MPRPIAAATGAVFGALSRVRGARIFHPRGVGYEATVAVDGADPLYPGVRLLEGPGEHRAIVRLSRAVGLPESLPDALGLSIRLVDLHGPGLHQDFLLVTSADAPLLRHLLLPAPGGFISQPYSSILFYRVADRLSVVVANPVDLAGHRPRTLAALNTAARTGALRFRLGFAPPSGRTRPVATLEVGDRIADAFIEKLAFNPWNSGGGINPVGALQGLRRAAYAGSQRGRGLPASEIP